jgi:penicillin G amidase
MSSKTAKILALVIGVLSIVIGVLIYGFRASLPTIEGNLALRGVKEPVTIVRDADGVVTIKARSELDEAFAMGVVHGQDRFFQMDLARRLAAGELSELVGSVALRADRKVRVHRFRARAQHTLEAMSDSERQIVTAYTNGVNAGLNGLHARPFEYWILRQAPVAWSAADTVLVVDSMFLQLQQGDGHYHIQRGLIEQALPKAVSAFVYAEASDWNASQDGSEAPVASLPQAADLNLRQSVTPEPEPAPDLRERHRLRERPVIGSNNWAIAGARTHSGGAMVANDMHLGLRVPNTWYRMRLECSCRENALTGVSLPGAPVVVVGSNGYVAWGFTNSYGDYQHVIALNQEGLAAHLYRTASGIEDLKEVHETINIKGEPAVDLPVLESRFGPVVETTSQGQRLVLEWVAHSPLAINLKLRKLADVRQVDEAIAVAREAGIPAQNFTVGDREGHIGWVIAGLIPKQQGPRHAIDRSDDPNVGFKGFVSPVQHPQIKDPKVGQIVTANARVVGGDDLAILGDGGYDRGARALQIVNDLKAKPSDWTESDALAVQIDDRAVFLTRWRDYLLSVLDKQALDGHPKRIELKTELERFSGHAAVNDAGYRLTRQIRDQLEQQLFAVLVGDLKDSQPAFEFHPPANFEGPMWMWLQQQPPHLLPAKYDSYKSLVLATIDGVLGELNQTCPVLAECTWGQVNRLEIRHPLSAAFGGLGDKLNMPSQPMPGDRDMPRAQGASFGASERMVVSPGHEQTGIFEMPTGQSGHPLSPFYGKGHDHWVKGEPSPFLPGPSQYTLTLTPRP